MNTRLQKLVRSADEAHVLKINIVVAHDSYIAGLMRYLSTNISQGFSKLGNTGIRMAIYKINYKRIAIIIFFANNDSM